NSDILQGAWPRIAWNAKLVCGGGNSLFGLVASTLTSYLVRRSVRSGRHNEPCSPRPPVLALILDLLFTTDNSQRPIARNPTMKRRRARIEDFAIGWICALHIELTAASEA